MNTPREPAFDNIVFTAAQLFRVPMAMLSLIGADQVWVKAGVGPLPRSVLREESFCTPLTDQKQVVVVENTTADTRFMDLPSVVGAPYIRFYAGAPIFSPDGLVIGSLCVMDSNPRTVPDRQRSQLKQLAQEAQDLMLLRLSGAVA